MIKVVMDDIDMDSFVFCLANKKCITRLQKDHSDLVRVELVPSLNVNQDKLIVSNYEWNVVSMITFHSGQLLFGEKKC